jgi:acetyltransferase-like isoleucine patch superfamily enzyme
LATHPENALPHGDLAREPAHPPRIRELLADDHGSALARYRRLVHPTGSALRFCLYELATMFLAPFPGAAGLWLRQKLLKPFFGAFGRGVVIGRNCTFRNPQGIFIGNGVVIDDNCVIDARGAGADGVHLSDGVLVSRGVQVKSKGGPIKIGRNVTIGDNSLVVSQTGISIDDGVGVATGCQIMGGTFQMSEFNRPATQRTSFSAGPIVIKSGAWLATGVIVLDAVQIGENAIVSAGSVVTRSVAARTIAQGNPAKKIFAMR